MVDAYSKEFADLDDPLERAYAVTPNDSADLSNYTRAIHVGGIGDLRVTTVRGDTVTLKNVIPGAPYPIRVRRIFATGTTATDIVALY